MIPNYWINLPIPPLAIEYTVMTNASLQVMGLHITWQAATKILRSQRLTNAADIVPLALDSK